MLHPSPAHSWRVAGPRGPSPCQLCRCAKLCWLSPGTTARASCQCRAGTDHTRSGSSQGACRQLVVGIVDSSVHLQGRVCRPLLLNLGIAAAASEHGTAWQVKLAGSRPQHRAQACVTLLGWRKAAWPHLGSAQQQKPPPQAVQPGAPPGRLVQNLSRRPAAWTETGKLSLPGLAEPWQELTTWKRPTCSLRCSSSMRLASRWDSEATCESSCHCRGTGCRQDAGLTESPGQVPFSPDKVQSSRPARGTCSWEGAC